MAEALVIPGADPDSLGRDGEVLLDTPHESGEGENRARRRDPNSPQAGAGIRGGPRCRRQGFPSHVGRLAPAEPRAVLIADPVAEMRIEDRAHRTVGPGETVAQFGDAGRKTLGGRDMLAMRKPLGRAVPASRAIARKSVIAGTVLAGLGTQQLHRCRQVLGKQDVYGVKECDPGLLQQIEGTEWRIRRIESHASVITQQAKACLGAQLAPIRGGLTATMCGEDRRRGSVAVHPVQDGRYGGSTGAYDQQAPGPKR